MPPDAHRLLVLRALWRTGSMQDAAAALHLTPSAVSQHLSRLEAETGLALVDRTRRGGGRAVGLTAAGHVLAERAEAVSVALAEAGREVQQLRDGSAATVRIGGFATALGRLAVPAIAQTAVSDSGLDIRIVETETEEGLRLLRADALDLLIADRVLSRGQRAGLASHDLIRDRYRVVVPRAWSTRTLAQLMAGVWVAAAPGQRARELLDGMLTDHGVAEPRLDHICTESRTMLALVATGLGAALVPDLTLAYQTTAGITVLDVDQSPGSRTLTAVTRRPPTYAVDQFRKMLQRTASTAHTTTAGVTTVRH
ncbi:LysR family transcriptional regulator [Williamsia sterculiae]|uniref:DNA-binding transcriptional regulator, LysR family n=1 Tax=Williamsia sterculiae TaxID=1344003 RepID=A0A1N7H0Y4_9NOCA|nr:LysR family transcriptional regulator [Williamsia sterculiae]SIS18481.1 DNA-binding transcriptional regulator, LysR family [Williamsia sterculiae]